MARKTKEEAEKTYFALLEAAADLYSSQGYARTTINEIASHAGMTRGAFYWHFQSKEDVIKGIWENHAYPGFNPVRQALISLPEDDPASAFRVQINRLIDVFARDRLVSRAMFIIIHNMEISDKEGDLHQFLSEQHQMFQDTIATAFKSIEKAGQLKANMDPKVTALSCLCLFVGMVEKALLPFMELDLETEGKELFASFFDAVLEIEPQRTKT
ncbi:TetR family transcriptional regulator [Cohaesibacter intestini]|uniref:TetR family transcriptional regulator n=1 Tax=Cohaesibacter intestini TaxID=2211145 RepID=UPI001300923C|nr:TetR family transcriptional regulator [Cohaesibacter intestini]